MGQGQALRRGQIVACPAQVCQYRAVHEVVVPPAGDVAGIAATRAAGGVVHLQDNHLRRTVAA